MKFMMTTDQVTKVNQVLNSPTPIDNLPPADAAIARVTEKTFTAGVALFKGHPVQEIRELATIMWDVIGHNLVQVVFTSAVKTMSFMAVPDGPTFNAAILVPSNWLDMVGENEILQAGGLISNGSMAVDFYNGRHVSEPFRHAQIRSWAYEATFLHRVKHDRPTHKFNDYQLALMKEYPQGVASPQVAPLMYKSKPFFIAQA